MSPISLKVGLGLVAVAGIFMLLQAQVVTNSLVVFAAAGIVPGTDISLSPTLMMAMSAVLLACGVVWGLVHFLRSARPLPDVSTDSVRPGAVIDAAHSAASAAYFMLARIWLEIPLFWYGVIVDAAEEWEWSRRRLLYRAQWLAVWVRQNRAPAAMVVYLSKTVFPSPPAPSPAKTLPSLVNVPTGMSPRAGRVLARRSSRMGSEKQFLRGIVAAELMRVGALWATAIRTRFIQTSVGSAAARRNDPAKPMDGSV